MDPKLIKQESIAYGPYVPGDYAIGDTVAAPSTSGEALWSYWSTQGLVYVVDDASGSPVKVQASDVIGQ